MKIVLILIAALFVCCGATPLTQAATDVIKQPVFAIVPDNHSYSAWELYLIVDRDNPQNVRALELDELTHKNAKDSTYEGVLGAARDANTPKKVLGTLQAADFGRGDIAISENNALHVSVSPAEKNTLRLNLSMRINLDQRFEIGGKSEGSRSVQFHYDAASKSWQSCANRMNDVDGRNAAGSGCLPITGIAFPVTGTGIYRIIAATTAGDAIIVMDR